MKRFPTYEESMVTTKENFFNLYSKFYKLSVFDKETGETFDWSSGNMSSVDILKLYLFLKTPNYERFTKYKTDNVSLYAASFLNKSRHHFLSWISDTKQNPNRYSLNFSFYSYGNGGAIVHYPSKSIFLEIPKCASTSLKNLPDSQFLYVTQTELETTYSDFKVYAIVRNPFERVISAFFELKHRVTDSKWPDEIYSKEPYRSIFTSDDDITNFVNFVNVIESVGIDFDAHVQSQSWCTFDSVETRPFRVDQFINFKNLSHISTLVGFSHKLQKMNAKASEPEKDLIRQLLIENNSIKQKIQHIYKEDFELFKKSSI
jgi:hypothetical protein